MNELHIDDEKKNVGEDCMLEDSTSGRMKVFFRKNEETIVLAIFDSDLTILKT